MLLMTYLRKYVSSKTKDVDVKLLNMIIQINEVKTLLKHFSCDFKCKFNIQYVIYIKNGVMTNVNANVKTVHRKVYDWYPSTCT